MHQILSDLNERSIKIEEGQSAPMKIAEAQKSQKPFEDKLTDVAKRLTIMEAKTSLLDKKQRDLTTARNAADCS